VASSRGAARFDDGSDSQLQRKVGPLRLFALLADCASAQLAAAEARAEILERNMACLFVTARLEIHRKNDEIAHLRAM
jgi:hypothetical protein